jgi:hypothetical protein
MKMTPVLQSVDAVTASALLDVGMACYCGALGHELIWRDEATSQSGLRTPASETEIVLSTRQDSEPDWKVTSTDAGAEVVGAHGGTVVVDHGHTGRQPPCGRGRVRKPVGAARFDQGHYDTDQAGNLVEIS